MHKHQKEITGSYQRLAQANIQNADMLYHIQNQAGISNLTNSTGENDAQQTTVFVSPVNKLWKVHTGENNIGKEFILKSTAIAAALKYVATRPEGSFSRIEIKGKLGNDYIYWALGEDEFPPQTKPAGYVKQRKYTSKT